VVADDVIHILIENLVVLIKLGWRVKESQESGRGNNYSEHGGGSVTSQ
jgi:hypothetical protein